jgi:DNA-directed RNA polymerase specialized sigma24 family protein
LLLDSTSRIAFVLHHVLRYKLGEAAAKTQMDEAEYRAQLRKAYLRLASVHSEEQVSGGKFLEEPALA